MTWFNRILWWNSSVIKIVIGQCFYLKRDDSIKCDRDFDMVGYLNTRLKSIIIQIIIVIFYVLQY